MRASTLWAFALWWAAFFIFIQTGWIATRRHPSSGAHLHRELQRTVAVFHELEETLAAGVLPTSARWAQTASLPFPWGDLVPDCLDRLRKSGVALLPSLKRWRALAAAQEKAYIDARAKASQAWAQAMICTALVPLFSAALFYLVPGLRLHLFGWLAVSVFAFLWAGTGSVWVLRMSERARWGGLKGEDRRWLFIAQGAGERFVALLRSGSPADLAWCEVWQSVKQQSPGLAAKWGSSFWSLDSTASIGGATGPLIELGGALKKAIQVSLMEGRPCLERAEVALTQLQQAIQAQVDRELQLLGTRALQPLFLCVAPALFGLLGVAFYWAGESALGGRFAI